MNKELKDYSEEVYKCSKCGLCQSVCPVYKKTGLETAVSRGKFTMLNGIITGKLKMSKKAAKNLELCLGCNACYSFCPSSISAEEIISAARHESIKINGMGFIKRFILENFRSNFRLSLLKLALSIYKPTLMPLSASAVQNIPFLKNYTNYIKLFNSQLRETVKYKKLTPVKPLSDLKIVYFPGCINNYVNSSVKNAVLMVLEKNGFNVSIPKDFKCCGIAARSSGDFKGFKELAEHNISQIFEDVDYILTDCASCGSVWEFYPQFAGEELKAKAEDLAAKTININKFLIEQDIYFPENSDLKQKVTYHDPCHLKRFQKVSEEPRQVLKNISGIEFKEMKDADVCCGAAGTFCVSQPEISKAISAEKAENIINTEAEIACTSCAGCKIGLYQGLIEKSSSIPVLHPVELLAKAYINCEK
jgi:glycolate oxidase iron-sulfur subunit